MTYFTHVRGPSVSYWTAWVLTSICLPLPSVSNNLGRSSWLWRFNSPVSHEDLHSAQNMQQAIEMMRQEANEDIRAVVCSDWKHFLHEKRSLKLKPKLICLLSVSETWMTWPWICWICTRTETPSTGSTSSMQSQITILWGYLERSLDMYFDHLRWLIRDKTF